MTLTIGKVAVQADVNVQTVRYYERRGLLAVPQRTRAGYRQYPAEAVLRIRFIKRSQELGFTLEETAELLALRVQHGKACGEVSQRARGKLAMVRQKQRKLERLEESLTRLIKACRGRAPTTECPILEAMEEPMPHA